MFMARTRKQPQSPKDLDFAAIKMKIGVREMDLHISDKHRWEIKPEKEEAENY